MMFTEELFKRALLDPAREGANHLYAVAGYASPALAELHFESIPDNVSVNLLIGMAGSEGLLRASHVGFQKLAGELFKNRFSCRYLIDRPPVHSKVYAWYNDEQPGIGFAGSPNYTQAGFLSMQEVLASIEPHEGKGYYESLLRRSIDCLDPNVKGLIKLHNTRRSGRRPKITEPDTVLADGTEVPDALTVTISFLSGGSLPQRSGLNWGQRPELGREPNQAYIRVPASIAKVGFFPARRERFKIITDDNFEFTASVAQAKGKAIHTPNNNSEFGRYFRKRLGVNLGDPVELEDLERYGRSDVTFTRVAEGLYYMDFSKKD